MRQLILTQKLQFVCFDGRGWGRVGGGWGHRILHQTFYHSCTNVHMTSFHDDVILRHFLQSSLSLRRSMTSGSLRSVGVSVCVCLRVYTCIILYTNVHACP